MNKGGKMLYIECETQEELDKCCKDGNIAIVRRGIFNACDSSQVRACDSSQVTACDSSQVTACDSSQVRAYDSSQVTACDSSQVRAYDSSQVRACDSSQVRACGYVAITQHGDYTKITKGKHCKLIKVPPIENLRDYLERYPIKQETDSVILYKAVSPELKSLCSSTPITYPKKGIIENKELDPPERGSCANGLHFAHLDWAINFGLGYGEFVLLKARIPKAHIVVSPDCDGKIRTDKAEILEVIEDWRSYQFKEFPT